MNTLAQKLTHAVTVYDRKQSGKAGYNPHALGIYLERVHEIVSDIDNGADVRKAIVAGFSGRLAQACLKALDLPSYTKADAMSGTVCYAPVSNHNP